MPASQKPQTPPQSPPQSMDIAAHNRAQLKRLFPEIVDEERVDFDALRAALGEIAAPVDERFGLSWHGKADCKRAIQAPSIATLKPDRAQSVDFDASQNLFIEGDNLEVLKLLQKPYFGTVKMIYIDPPYNTGKEFIYPDKFGESLDTYLEYTGQKDRDGRRFSTNTETEGRYHSNWLNMMYPRLYLARNLLREDGVIFISIDDNEQDNLKKLCNEIFGEENFVATIAWQGMDTIKNDAKYFSSNHEYILCFAKQKESLEIAGLKRTEEHNKVYKNRDNDSRGPYLLTPLHAKSGTENNRFEYVFDNGFKYQPPPNRYWRFSKVTLKKLEGDNRIYFPENGGTPQNKTFLSEVSDRVNLTTFWSSKFAGSTRQSNNELTEVIGKGMFPNSKPTKLLTILVDSIVQKDDIILDFFAGSATTAHAVLALNAEDRGNRKFICVQLPEPCGEDSEAYKAGYRSIADIGRERIRRAAAQIGGESGEKAADLDLGFRAFRLDRSNFAVWEGDVDKILDLAAQLERHAAHLDSGSSDEDILYELLLKSGYSLTTPVATKQLAGKRVFCVEAENGGNSGEKVGAHSERMALLICLERELNQELLDAIAAENPQEVICLDAGFQNNDQLKANAVQTFQSLAQQDVGEIVFRTV